MVIGLLADETDTERDLDRTGGRCCSWVWTLEVGLAPRNGAK